MVADIPCDVDSFIDWFEDLKETGPGQGDPLFPWLAEAAGRDEMLWFLTQEVAGEAGFDDLLGTHPGEDAGDSETGDGAKLLGRMGRGRETAMHGPLLEGSPLSRNRCAAGSCRAGVAWRWGTQCWQWREAGVTASNRSVRLA